MKKAKILENLSLKILAVFISILLWLIVINVSDPVSDTSYSDIPLTVVNADSITSQGKVYDITSDDTVSISVSAKRSILDSLGKDNFKGICPSIMKIQGLFRYGLNRISIMTR